VRLARVLLGNIRLLKYVLNSEVLQDVYPGPKFRDTQKNYDNSIIPTTK